jgi:soluble lytic murein transglycosylase-like protein
MQHLARALGRTKLGTGAMTIVAALSAYGLTQRHDAARTTSASAAIEAVTQPADYVRAAAAIVARKPVMETKVAAAISKRGLTDLEHPRVDSWVRRFTGDQRRSFATYLQRKTRYERMISRKLEQRDMPQELIYLAMIESGFNPTAKSRVAATGLWQFMTPTARQYGLKVSRRADERKNPERATEAALAYLQDLHDRFGSWYLAAAAYNTGQGRVARVMKQVVGRTKGTDADFYRIAPRLPKETREYVPKLVAAARIGADPAKYGFGAD